ncbi:hypothetical protein C2W62_33030, partial [Candidatus Entotheonella serta]
MGSWACSTHRRAEKAPLWPEKVSKKGGVGGPVALASRTLYPTDLSDAEWGVLQPLVPADKPGSQPEKYAKRDILNGIFYSLRSGCAWRLLPHQLPPWRSVYHYCRLWRNDGTWKRIHDR